jgi:hypothetical protein
VIDRRLALLLVAAAGCMRIYPDPELPDVIVEWLPECGDDGVTVRLEAVGDDGVVVTSDVACADGKGRIEDLTRGPQRITGALLDARGEVLGRALPAEVDLTAGHSVRTYVSSFARDEAFVRTGWAFSGGDTCESLRIGWIVLDYVSEDLGESGTLEVGWCADEEELQFFATVDSGTYTMQAFALGGDDGSAVAASEPRPGVVIGDRGAVVDLGTFQLTRCAAACDREPPEWPDSWR